MRVEDRERLGQYVMAARKRMGYRDRKPWAEAIGISAKTLGKLERGEYVGTDTLVEVENFFGWTPGSAREILRGGQPTAMPAADDTPTDDEILAMDARAIAERYVKTDRDRGKFAADDWLFQALTVRLNARREANGTLAVDGS